MTSLYVSANVRQMYRFHFGISGEDESVSGWWEMLEMRLLARPQARRCGEARTVSAELSSR